MSNALGRTRFADELVDVLIKLGVEYLFGMPAESVNSLVHAASRRTEIEVVTTRHEAAAALMAVGYAKSSGRLGVCFGTAGPGATNLLTGAYEAYLGRVPLVAISGQVPVASLGRDAFQEIDSEALFRSCTSSSVQIQSPSQFERFARSCVQALHESTACHVAIPGDVLYAPLDGPTAGYRIPEVPTATVASKEQLAAIAEFLDSDDLAVVSSDADSTYLGLVQKLSARLGCPAYTVRDGGAIAAQNVLLVGRTSPLLARGVCGHANLMELTDRRCMTRSLPYRTQIVCDVEATLQSLMDDGSSDETTHGWQTFTDLDPDGLRLPEGLAAAAAVSSLAGIPGAALPLGIGGALGGRSRGVVVTDYPRLSQFVAELATLASLNADVVAICLTDGPETSSRLKHLGTAMSLGSVAVASVDDLSRRFAGIAARPGPVLIAVPGGTAPKTAASPLRPGERSLARHLSADLAAPVQISDFCAQLLPSFATAQRSANVQAPSMSASALRKSGIPSAGTVAATEAALLSQLNGIYDAALDSARILVTTVETQRWFLDARRVLDEVTVARYLVDDAATASAAVRRACAAAAAPGGGVVHLHVLPSALDSGWAETEDAPPPAEPGRGTGPDESSLARAVGALRAARRVGIVAGRGAAGCSEQLAELSRLLSCPVHVTMGGDSVLDRSIPRVHSRIGGSGDLRSYRQVARADVLLLVGVSNRGSAFDWGACGRTVAVNLDPRAMLGLTEHDIGLLCDAMPALEAIVAALCAAPPDTVDPSARRQRSRRWPAGRRTRKRARRTEIAPLRASNLTQAIDEELRRHGGTSVVCADVGVNTLWVYRYITSMTRSIWSASFGTMGFAVPAAIALANNATRPQLVVAVAGDGGTSVTLSQIQSSIGVPAPVVFVVVNNSALAAIKFESEIMGWPDSGSALPEINFADYARSVGVPARSVGTLREFRSAFTEAIHAHGPQLIDARCVLNDAPIQAGKKHWRQVVGFLVAWSKDIRGSVGSFREVVRAVILGKLYEKGYPARQDEERLSTR
ncbi:hypothetical protein H7J50_12715 [Mycobacterium intermedium]|uniref:thiamine pyrophosphate-binding protein n=1 Tax=Mycobacterium intermedium TaxID=28445 RepID=UPI001474AADC|nr:thiamine pyrophosphate-binding protein [Mycobacterium intermedium]MCV6964663.1 hypothetical protein [Mycobacterium intermedium]